MVRKATAPSAVAAAYCLSTGYSATAMAALVKAAREPRNAVATRLAAVAAMNNRPAVVARTSRDLMARLLLTKPRPARPARTRLPGRQCLVARV
jgi:hypothetical protein